MTKRGVDANIDLPIEHDTRDQWKFRHRFEEIMQQVQFNSIKWLLCLFRCHPVFSNHAVLALVLLLWTFPLTSALAAASADNQLTSWSRFEIGPEMFHYHYKESGLMEMDGILMGVDGRWTWYNPRLRHNELPNQHDDQPPSTSTRQEKLIFHIHGRYAQGQTDYDGQLLDSANTPYRISGIDASTFELRALAGYAPYVSGEAYTAFSIGFGIRFKDDDSSFDPSGYKRESTYRYVPIAVRHTRHSSGGNQWSFALEYDHLMSGDHVTTLPGERGIRKHQSSGYGIRASFAINGSTGRLDWTLEPFARYWNIEDSNFVFVRTPVGIIQLYEPANTTLELGASVRVLF